MSCSNSSLLLTMLVLGGCGGGAGGSGGGGGPTAMYSVGGTITGLSASGLVLANGADTVSPMSAASTFTFPTQMASGANYSVSFKTQPTGQTCTLASATGMIAASNVSSVQVTCTTNTYVLGGTVDGLVAGGLTLKNGTVTIPVLAMATSFAFMPALPYGTSYAVTLQTQPTGQNCQISNASGSAGTGTIAVRVSCAGQQWTWLGGSNLANAGGMYGTKGTAAAANIPGARAGGLTWSDSVGSLWLFGGYGNDGAGTAPGMGTAYLNDLWTYNPASGLWTWVSGSNASQTSGVYGTPGVAGVLNGPGGRNYAVSWVDGNGALWLFGGRGYATSASSSGDLNDLWKYDPASKMWTWVSGTSVTNSAGIYSTPGSLMPGAREGASAWFDPVSGRLWLFGGYGYDSNVGVGLVDLNDLWSFDPITKLWTFEAGSTTGSASGVYGTMGTAAPSNFPGARQFAAAWSDSSTFWLFGGNGYPSSPGSNAALNDLWAYNKSTKLWTWVSGSSTGGVLPGMYGIQGMAGVSNVPGGRTQAVAWRDSLGLTWLFGGQGYDKNGMSGSLNDLWKFDPSAVPAQWTWVAGANTVNAAGIYGILGAAAATNAPGARQLASAWIGAYDTLWLFGGYGYDSATPGLHYMNDLWFVIPQ